MFTRRCSTPACAAARFAQHPNFTFQTLRRSTSQIRSASTSTSGYNNVQEYLHTSLGIDHDFYRELQQRCSTIDDLSIEDSVAPVVTLFQQCSTQQRIRKLLRRSPAILASPLEAWYEFLSGYGFNKAGFVKLLETTPEVFSSTSLFQAGTLIAHLKAMGLQDSIIVPAILRFPQLLSLDLHAQLLPVLSFLYDLGCSASCVSDLVSRSPRILSRSVDFDLRPKVDYFIHDLGFTRQQLAALAEADPGFLATDLDSETKPKLTFLKSLGLTSSQVQRMLSADPHLLANALPNLQRKWTYLQTVMNGTAADLISYPSYFSHNLLLVIGPRYSLVCQHNLAPTFTSSSTSSSTSSTSSSTVGETKARLSEALHLKQQSSVWFDARHDVHQQLQQQLQQRAGSSSGGCAQRPELALLLGPSNAEFAALVGLSSAEWGEYVCGWVQGEGLRWSGVNVVGHKG